MTVASNRVPCANHPESASLGRCIRCRTSLCDSCIAFAINDDPWCEACGTTIEEEARPRYARGVVVVSIAWGLVSAIWAAKVLFVPMPIPYFFGVLFLGYGGGLYAAWNAVSPVTGVEAPAIVRRRPGSALPKRLNPS